MLKLFELVGSDPERAFSPYVWRTRLALAHKGLAYESIPWRFTEKAAIEASGQGKVPVLVDGERWIADSTVIANYLEDTWPDRPSLFGGHGGRALTRFVIGWTDAVVVGGMFRLIARDILDQLGPEDAAYFRKSREERLGMTLEAFVADREAWLPGFRESLVPVRLALRGGPFLGGDSPLYADYTVFGAFQWARGTSLFPLLAANDPIVQWRERMLDLYDGLARKAKGLSA